ncbi:MAG: glycoside hydrolase family 3 N-terminal domain-containing protein [Solirubrobacterales bacterium]
MEATRRRRRVAVALGCGRAAGAFAFGVALVAGGSTEPSATSRLTLRQLAGERLVVGLPGTSVPPELKRMIGRGALAGVILFAGNFPSRAAGRRLVADLQAIRRPPGLREPLLVMVDQEGGQVKRVDGVPIVSAREMGSRGAAYSSAQGAATAANLRDVGVNVDLAPVLDVARPGGEIADTDRAFGGTATRVAATAVPFATALQGGRVAATGKHFPGFGSARRNTDIAVQRIGLSKGELRRVDEAPYRTFVAAGGEMVMLSTAIYPAFSPKPAAFAPEIATGELRQRLGFEGVSITDGLEGVAVRHFGGPLRSGLAAARAGTDLLLFPDFEVGAEAQAGLLRALRSGRLARADFETSAGRVLRLRHRLAAPPGG